jgi:hypothetical protein
MLVSDVFNMFRLNPVVKNEDNNVNKKKKEGFFSSWGKNPKIKPEENIAKLESIKLYASVVILGRDLIKQSKL